MNALVPELDVSDLAASLAFYRGLGFDVVYQRPEEAFAFLRREDAELMLQAAAGPGRRFPNAPLEPPFGRGVNLQIAAEDVDRLHADAIGAGWRPLIALEERWYRIGAEETGNRQFVLADPDGYLLRFFQDLGRRPADGPRASPGSPGPAGGGRPSRS